MATHIFKASRTTFESNPPPVTSTVSVGTVSFTLSNARGAGYSLKDWKARLSSHLDATTNLTGSRQYILGTEADSSRADYIRTIGSVDYACNEQQKGTFPFNNVMPTTNSGLDASAYDALVAKFYKLMVDRQTGSNVPMILGEGKETLRMLLNPTKALTDYILGTQLKRTKRGFQKLRKKGLSARSRDADRLAADLWLQFQFGVKPLMSDIEDALTMWNNRLDELLYEEFNIFSKQESTVMSGVTTVRTFGRIRYDEKTYTIARTSYRCYGETYTQFGGTRAQLGLRWGNFVPTAWELLPWSFFIDYFSNIGDVLGAAFVDMGMLRRASVVRRRQGIRVCTFSNVRDSATQTNLKRTATIAEKRLVTEAFSRTLGFNVSPPRLRLEIPGYSLKWANMLALAKGAYRGASRI